MNIVKIYIIKYNKTLSTEIKRNSGNKFTPEIMLLVSHCDNLFRASNSPGCSSSNRFISHHYILYIRYQISVQVYWFSLTMIYFFIRPHSAAYWHWIWGNDAPSQTFSCDSLFKRPHYSSISYLVPSTKVTSMLICVDKNERGRIRSFYIIPCLPISSCCIMSAVRNTDL